MAGSSPRITDGEWSVLERLWELQSASIRQLAEALYPSGGVSEYATVHKFLERLEAKGCVRRRRQEGVYRFEAIVGRDELIGRELTALVDKMAGASLQPLLTNLVRVNGLTAKELRELLDLVDDLDRQKKSKKKRD
jgi:predicted transcriptional regulator